MVYVPSIVVTTQWTTCPKTCGVGKSTRNRSCQGGSCSGSGFESMDCTTTPRY